MARMALPRLIVPYLSESGLCLFGFKYSRGIAPGIPASRDTCTSCTSRSRDRRRKIREVSLLSRQISR